MCTPPHDLRPIHQAWPYGPYLSTRLHNDQNAEAVAHFLASAIVMCALPYLEVPGESEAAATLLATARAAGVTTTLT